MSLRVDVAGRSLERFSRPPQIQHRTLGGAVLSGGTRIGPCWLPESTTVIIPRDPDGIGPCSAPSKIGLAHTPVRRGAQLISRPIMYNMRGMRPPSRNRCTPRETEDSPFPPLMRTISVVLREVVARRELPAPDKSRASRKSASGSTEQRYLPMNQ